jgi:hypothetical protein
LKKALTPDEPPGRPHDAPDAAELRHVLTEDLAGPAVADVVVKRLPGVSDLQRAV